MVNLLAKSKIHQTYRQVKKIHRHRRKLKNKGIECCHVVSGYPKSGNTWVARMLSDAIRCKMIGYLSDVDERVPHETSLETDELLDDVVVVKSHHTVSLLTLGGVNPNDIVFVVRDPRDISVSGSGFLFASDNVPSEKRIDQMIDLMVETQKPKVRWQDLCWREFVQGAIDKDVLMVRYEDLLQDTAGSLRRILTRLGYARSDDQIEHVVRLHSFDASRVRAQASGRDDVLRYLRQGQSGVFQTYLTPRQRQRIESEFRYTMKYLNYL